MKNIRFLVSLLAAGVLATAALHAHEEKDKAKSAEKSCCAEKKADGKAGCCAEGEGKSCCSAEKETKSEKTEPKK